MFLGKVFVPANVWPSSCEMLKPAMLEAYTAFEKLSEALLLLLGDGFRPWQSFPLSTALSIAVPGHQHASLKGF